MKLRKAIVAVGVVSAFLLAGSSAAGAVVSGDQGVPADNTSFTWNFSGTTPAVTASFTGTPAANMRAKGDYSSWGGGNTSWSSLQLDGNPYTPDSVLGANNYGLGMGWDSTDQLCTSTLPANGAIVPGTIYTCAPQSITLTFSGPVTNPVINVTNIAGGSTYASLWSSYRLRGAGSVVLRSKLGNFAVSNDHAGFGVINPPGTGFDAAASAQYEKFDALPNSAAPNLYGAGYGAVQVMGTFTSLTFDVEISYVNFTTSQLATGNTQTTNRVGVPEWVAFTPALGVQALPEEASESDALASTGATNGIAIFLVALEALFVGTAIVSLALIKRKRS